MSEGVVNELEHWGRWARLNGGTSSGYPKSTAYARAAKHGVVLPSSNLVNIPDDNNAERMERLMIRLKTRYPDSQAILVMQYMKNKELNEIARIMKASVATIKTWRRIGLSWLDASLDPEVISVSNIAIR